MQGLQSLTAFVRRLCRVEAAARTSSSCRAATWSCIKAMTEKQRWQFRSCNRRDLIAERFAAAGWHDHEGVAARADLVHDLRLQSSEGGIAEGLTKDGQGLECAVRIAKVVMSWGINSCSAGLPARTS